MIYDDISQTIGRTPVVRINRLAPQHVTMSDTGERYLSTVLFEGVPTGSDTL
jgi:hypothetical protein